MPCTFICPFSITPPMPHTHSLFLRVSIVPIETRQMIEPLNNTLTEILFSYTAAFHKRFATFWHSDYNFMFYFSRFLSWKKRPLDAFMKTLIFLYLWLQRRRKLIKIKIKVTLEQATKPQKRSRGTALPFFNHGTWCGGWSTSRIGRFIRRNDPILIVQQAGWAWGRIWRVREISPQTGFDPRTVQPAASRYTDWAIPAAWTKTNLPKT